MTRGETGTQIGTQIVYVWKCNADAEASAIATRKDRPDWASGVFRTGRNTTPASATGRSLAFPTPRFAATKGSLFPRPDPHRSHLNNTSRSTDYQPTMYRRNDPSLLDEARELFKLTPI